MGASEWRERQARAPGPSESAASCLTPLPSGHVTGDTARRASPVTRALLSACYRLSFLATKKNERPRFFFMRPFRVTGDTKFDSIPCHRTKAPWQTVVQRGPRDTVSKKDHRDRVLFTRRRDEEHRGLALVTRRRQEKFRDDALFTRRRGDEHRRLALMTRRRQEKFRDHALFTRGRGEEHRGLALVTRRRQEKSRDLALFPRHRGDEHRRLALMTRCRQEKSRGPALVTRRRGEEHRGPALVTRRRGKEHRGRAAESKGRDLFLRHPDSGTWAASDRIDAHGG